MAEEIEQKRLLEELRSLENVARSWEDQDGWRIVRLLDALNRESDENGSISSGCETASTATSEERATGPEEQLVQSQYCSQIVLLVRYSYASTRGEILKAKFRRTFFKTRLFLSMM